MMPTPTSPPPRRPSAAHAVRLALAAALCVGAVVAGGGPASAAFPVPRPPVAPTTAPDAPSRYQGQVSCAPGETPGAAALRELLRSTYGRANTGGVTRGCSVGGTSEHKEGRAYDWMLNAANPAEKELADTFNAWLVGPDAQGVHGGNARRLGVQYVIFNRATWQAWDGRWEPYTGSNPHTDHVHISLSWDGAYQRTSWWTGSAVTQVDRGPCPVYVGELAPAYSGPTYSACPAPVPRSPSGNGTLVAGQGLVANQEITSPNRRFRAAMQADGNFVVYEGTRPLFHTRTWTSPGARLAVQADGNVVVYSRDSQPLWHSDTWRDNGSRLVLQDDGNLVVYRPDGRPVWNIQVSGPGLIKG